MNENNLSTPPLRLTEMSVMDWWQLYCARNQVDKPVSRTSEFRLRKTIEAFVIGVSGQADWDKVPATRLLERRSTLQHWVTVGRASPSELTERALQDMYRPLFVFSASFALQFASQISLDGSNAAGSGVQQGTRPNGDRTAQVSGLQEEFKKMETFCRNLSDTEARSLSLRPLKISTHMEASLHAYTSFLKDVKGVAAPTLEDLINRQWFEAYLQDATVRRQRSKAAWLLHEVQPLSRIARYLQATGRLAPEELTSFWNMNALRALAVEAFCSAETGLKA
ncbi:hypothetical protein [Deinococcus sp. UYEF24]